jgi:hypothetical protein
MNGRTLGANWQLFIDDYIVARSTGFSRVVHPPRPMGVVIPADKPWETRGVVPLYVWRDAGGRFHALCTAMWWDWRVGEESPHPGVKFDRAHWSCASVGYAVSDDGLSWVKPDLGLIDAPAELDRSVGIIPQPKGATRKNNLGVPIGFVRDLGLYGNVKDPQKRFAVRPGIWEITHADPAKAYFAAEMPDFLHDPDWRKKLIDSGGSFNPRRRTLHFWDDVNEEWVAMEQGVVGNWLPSREIARYASKDLKTWHGQSVLYPDAADPHRPERYDEPMHMISFHSDGVVLGLLAWFYSDRTHPYGGPRLVDTTKPTGHPDHWPFARKGFGGTRITLSRDGGKTWDRTSSRVDWIPPGPEEDSYDRIAWPDCPPVYVGDEDWFYMTANNGDHLPFLADAEQSSYYSDRQPVNQTALYVQKHNRYVSLSAGDQVETLITQPLQIDGGELRLNVDASRGRVRVALAEAKPVCFLPNAPAMAPHFYQRAMLEGFSLDDCEPIHSDSVDQVVRFRGRSVASLKGKTVYVAIEAVNADIFGLRAV